MTILNIAIGANDAAILTDSRLSWRELAADECATKVLALPAHWALLAHTGFAMGGIVQELHSYLRLGVLGGNVLDLARRMPQVLRDLDKTHAITAGWFGLVGMVGDSAHGFRFEAPTWDALPIPQGIVLMPPLRSPESYAAADLVVIADSAEPPPEPRSPPDFKDSVRAITLAAHLQAEENLITCGGPLILSLIDSQAIRQMRVDA